MHLWWFRSNNFTGAGRLRKGDVMDKNELIAAIQAAGQRLGRDVDVQGSKAELEIRLQELQDELGSVYETGGELHSSSGADGLARGDGHSRVVRVVVAQTLHLNVLNAGIWRADIVNAGETAHIAAEVARELQDVGLVSVC
ncbi:TPA: hypothetical protein G8L55_004809 [Salmonella enterica]|uniref:Uncharacterized protein n=5 Tax=Salmonella enterica TaxID=28901 RepID=A0A5Y1WMC0_SALER|nr:hypothetical protein [Salmonella enterica subsp. enterica serovar Abony]EAA9532579.1 hypothetical protein [Salmonella enterica subsp. enterica serovar Vitkin]EAB4068536.1 hypothetical protein [Salmonella enterica]EAB6966731.1 hypothetical protein [Salmonella enterica subsp. enterica serovar Kottbus]EAB7502265.1 hypothetical protein [Salmonella enterica subsp. enterica]EBF9677999.1 hypothetical protein [Salmonella enterica subsp. enterica serovar Glostrup]EBH9949110.1 hypothetical protein [